MLLNRNLHVIYVLVEIFFLAFSNPGPVFSLQIFRFIEKCFYVKMTWLSLHRLMMLYLIFLQGQS